MSLKRDNISMPMASAGIMGLSPTTDLGGKSMDAKAFLIAVVVIVIAIHIAGILVPTLT